MEAKWREAHNTLRDEIAKEIGSIREAREEQQQNAVRLLTEFEVELTAALEARMKEADSLVERRLIEAGEGMQRRLVEFEATVSDERSKFVSLEGDSHKRLEGLETAIDVERKRVTEQTQRSDEALQAAKDQLTIFRQNAQQLQEDANETKDNVATCRQRLQQMQEEREDIKEQINLLRQRLGSLAAETCSTGTAPVEVESRRMFGELEGRMQHLEDGLAARFRESEARLRNDTSEELASLRQRVQSEARLRTDASEDLASLRQRVLPLLDAATAGGTSGSLGAEGERRLQRLDEALGARICESEGRLLAQQRALEGQSHEARLELQRQIGEMEHRVSSELRLLDTRSAAGRLEERFEDFKRTCETELAAARERLESIEMRCSDEVREMLRTGLDEVEARTIGTTEAGVAAQFEALRAELRVEAWPCSGRRDQRSLTCGDVHHQLAQGEEDRRVFSEELEALADRQRRQQHLLEDLLSAAARRPSNFSDGVQLNSSGGTAAGPLPAPIAEPMEAVGKKLEAISTRLTFVEDRVADRTFGGAGLAARLTVVEERLASAGSRISSAPEAHGEVGSSSAAAAAVELAERCSGRLDLLSVRLASVEDRVAAAAAPAATTMTEVQEALRTWPPKLEELAVRLDNGNTALRSELVKEFRDGLQRAKEESGRHQAQVEDLRNGLQRVQEESGRHRAEVEALITCTTNSISDEKRLHAEEVARYSRTEQSAVTAEKMASRAAEEAKNLRQIAEKAELSCTESVAALEKVVASDVARSQARILVEESESRELAAMMRLEARLESAEARQILAFTELSERLEEELHRDTRKPSLCLPSLPEERTADVDLRRPASKFNAQRGDAFSDGADQAWRVPLRSLEVNLKALMAAQAEDSAAALRSMALMVEESVLRDTSSLRADTTMLRHDTSSMVG
jgi:hypothetical protein